MTVYRLEGGVQHYAWGDRRFIPDLLGIDNDEDAPYAELWLGDHPSLPSRVHVDGCPRSLPEVLGHELPYLLKILAAAEPLSIQAHPSAQQAREGYRRENALGIPLSASNRSYKDDRPKPELLCALTDFYALRGFRRDQPPELAFAGDGPLEERYARLMTMPQEEVDRALAPLVDSSSSDRHGPDEREYWIRRCHEAFSEPGHYDRGLFSVYLLNLVHLRPGEAIYLDAGTLHAYLKGSGVEVMASSNNVLRGGLTKKHIDIPELLATIRFQEEDVRPLRARAAGRGTWRYETPAEEFELFRVGGGHVSDADHGPEIAIVIDGELELGGERLRRGQAVLIPPGVEYVVRGSGAAYKAGVRR